MSNLLAGVLAGFLFGAASVATMLPRSFPDKTAALAAAFVDRFAIGLVIGCIQLPWPGWVSGLVFDIPLPATHFACCPA